MHLVLLETDALISSYLLVYMLPEAMYCRLVELCDTSSDPKGYECGVMPVIRVEGFTVVSVPFIEDSLLFYLEEPISLGEIDTGCVTLVACMLEKLEVYCPFG